MTRTYLLRAAQAICFAALLAGCNSSPAAPTVTPPASCSFAVGGAPADAVLAAGMEFTVSITTTASCAWTVASSAAFITTVGASSGTGTGTAKFSVAANTGAARQASITIGTQTLLISQQAGAPQSCTYTVSPTSASAAQGGGDVSFDVTAGANCAWTTTTGDAFVTIKQGASGSGNGTVVLTLAANAGSARTGSANIAGTTVTLSQAGTGAPSCAFSVSPGSVTAPAAASTTPITLTVTQGTNCAWTAVSITPWLSFTLPTSGTGNGSVTLTIAANSGVARTGFVTVAGQTVTVNQAASTSTGVPVLMFSFTSDPGDFVGAGQSNSVTLTGSQFSVGIGQATSQVTFSPTAPTFFNVTFGAPTGVSPLVPGLYGQAARLPSVGVARMDIGYASRGCNQVTGRFLVDEAVYAAGNLRRLHVKFQQHCEGWSTALRGELWFDDQGVMPPPTMPDLPPPPGSPTTFLSWTSDPGDSIGQGQPRTFTLANMKFQGWHFTSTPVVSMRIETPTTANFERWTLEMMAPSGAQLTPGTYLTATRYPFNPAGTPGLSFGGAGRGCNTVTGFFTVLEASYGPNGEVYRFRATFEQHCEGAVPALRGEIYIVADPWR